MFLAHSDPATSASGSILNGLGPLHSSKWSPCHSLLLEYIYPYNLSFLQVSQSGFPQTFNLQCPHSIQVHIYLFSASPASHFILKTNHSLTHYLFSYLSCLLCLFSISLPYKVHCMRLRILACILDYISPVLSIYEAFNKYSLGKREERRKGGREEIQL